MDECNLRLHPSRAEGKPRQYGPDRIGHVEVEIGGQKLLLGVQERYGERDVLVFVSRAEPNDTEEEVKVEIMIADGIEYVRFCKCVSA